eukprot:4399104-Pleurochrysis_carterae.AAC.1
MHTLSRAGSSLQFLCFVTSAYPASPGMREVERLKLEMDRRHAEGLRREAALQRSREELASTFAQFQRDAASELARVRDEEQAKQKRLEGEKNRLQARPVGLSCVHSVGRFCLFLRSSWLLAVLLRRHTVRANSFGNWIAGETLRVNSARKEREERR